jgi:hypothetical protein
MKKQRIGYDLPGAECCPAVLCGIRLLMIVEWEIEMVMD